MNAPKGISPAPPRPHLYPLGSYGARLFCINQQGGTSGDFRQSGDHSSLFIANDVISFAKITSQPFDEFLQVITCKISSLFQRQLGLQHHLSSCN